MVCLWRQLVPLGLLQQLPDFRLSSFQISHIFFVKVAGLVDASADMIDVGFITITKRGKILFDIPIDDENVEVLDGFIKLYLTQEQTLQFDVSSKTELQIRLGLTTLDKVASNIINIPVEKILKDGVI